MGTNNSNRSFGDSLASSHREVLGPGGVDPGVEHLGDVRVVHERERLPLLFEPGQGARGLHAGLDDLHGHAPRHRFRLVGDEDGTHAAFAEFLAQLVTPGEDFPRLGGRG
jgi:hypothetical protein